MLIANTEREDNRPSRQHQPYPVSGTVTGSLGTAGAAFGPVTENLVDGTVFGTANEVTVERPDRRAGHVRQGH